VDSLVCSIFHTSKNLTIVLRNDKLVETIGNLITKSGIDMNRKGSVVLARDTRCVC